MNRIDANAVVEGSFSFEFFLEELLKFDNHLEMVGSAMLHCLQGSNRSGVVACAYLIGKCQTSATHALRHLQLVRPIIDVAEPAFGNRVLPGQWLQEREQLIMARFRDMSKTIVALPDTVSAHRLRSMVSLRCIRDRQAQGQPSRLSQEEEARLHKEIEQLKADSAEAKKEAERAPPVSERPPMKTAPLRHHRPLTVPVLGLILL